MANGIMNEVAIRAACAKDIAGLRAFGKDLYAGHDYLEVAFPHLLHNKHSYPYVAVDNNGKVVAFKNYTVIDDRTVLSLGGRVLPSNQGLGLNKALSMHLDDVIRRRIPTVTHRASVQRGGERTDRFANFTDRLEQIFKWETFRGMTNDIHQIKQLEATDGKFAKLSVLRAIELVPEISDRLGSKWSYIVYPGPLAMNVTSVNESNVRHILNTCDVIASASEVSRHKMEGCFSLAGVRLGVSEKLIISSIFYYGESRDELLGHIPVALKHFARLAPDDSWRLGLTVQFPLNFEKQPIYDYLTQWFKEQSIPGYRSDFALNLVAIDQEDE